MAVFVPRRVLIEREALDYQLGRELRDRFRDAGVATAILPESNRVTGLPGDTPAAAYREAKQTLVIAVRRTLRFQTCKPSAHYQLPLVTSCPGMCEYCYLQTTLGRRPVIRAYVNLDEILAEAKRLISARVPEVTVFEGAATADPLPVERYTGGLARAITFFADEEHGRFRFVTKFSDVEPLLPLPHGRHTRFRFSINTGRVIAAYEHNTAPLAERIAAAAQAAAAGYPLGFLVAPIFLEGDWRAEYSQLLTDLQRALAPTPAPDVTFELITHRFTARAKANISAVFPQTTLPLDEAARQFKYGQFGYGKYLYPADERAEAKAFLTDAIARLFPQGRVEYLV